GLADNGDLEHDLQDLIEQVGLAAKAAGTALAIFIDELQYVKEDQLAALITAMHRAQQRQLPVVLVGAGLPQLRARMGNAKSYAERLFDFPEIGALPNGAAHQATSLAPTRSTLINKGMIWSPSHGDTAFTVPMFDQFMKRNMPGDAWRSEK